MILVTGATGLVGACLTHELLKEGHAVRALKRKESSKAAFDFWMLKNPAITGTLEWVEGDVLDIESLEIALKDITHVFHCAALISSDPSETQLMEAVNTRGTANLVNLCLELPGLLHFAHVSSVAALGRVENEQVFDEESHWQPGKHNSAYAISKYGAEREVWRGIAEGLPAVMVNPSVIIGPGNWNQGSCRLFPLIAKGFPFYSDGVTGYVDVRDVTGILRKLSDKKITGERYLLNSENISYQTLFTWIADFLNAKKPAMKITPWMSEVAWRLFAFKKLFTGKASLISKSYARTSQRKITYRNNKVCAFLDYKFIPIKEAVAFTAKAYLQR